jgi:hypothetical protein
MFELSKGGKSIHFWSINVPLNIEYLRVKKDPEVLEWQAIQIIFVSVEWFNIFKISTLKFSYFLFFCNQYYTPQFSRKLEKAVWQSLMSRKEMTRLPLDYVICIYVVAHLCHVVFSPRGAKVRQNRHFVVFFLFPTGAPRIKNTILHKSVTMHLNGRRMYWEHGSFGVISFIILTMAI